MVDDFIKHDQTGSGFTDFQCLPIESLEHICYGAGVGIETGDKSRCSTLNIFNLIYMVLGMRVPN
jgi:hypothetical protein